MFTILTTLFGGTSEQIMSLKVSHTLPLYNVWQYGGINQPFLTTCRKLVNSYICIAVTEVVFRIKTTVHIVGIFKEFS